MNDILLSTEKLEKAAYILKTVAHPLRLGIVDILRNRDKVSVNEICQILDSEQSLTSHHLNNLRAGGLLGFVKEGKQVYYFLKFKEVSLIIDCIQQCDTQNFNLK
jgi:ArsR family transcriptional regulator